MLIYKQARYIRMKFLDPKYIIMGKDHEDDEERLEINSFADWREFIKTYGEQGFNTIKIYDEYSQLYTEEAFFQEVADFYEISEFKKKSQEYATKYKDHFWLDDEGYCMGEPND
jgi:hypothetical protein